uniref:Uncharacterized protein n=1 Tax=Tanacetum cinerariifolium TaxID=118510 RepID=A0A6L2LTL0_TANCI|nr:hypothetical protein [Tanacetum cinerariifolium]
MVESSSHNTSLPKITPKEEPATLDKPESLNPFLHADQIEFTFDEIAFTTNNEVALLYPSHPNSEYFREVLDFISKCCLKEAFTRPPTQYKEYLCEFWYTTKTLDDSKIWVSSPTVQEKLKTLDSLPSLLNKVKHLFTCKGEKNTTKDTETNLQNELVDLLDNDMVEQYHKKKLLFDKYCNKMLKRRKSSKIIKCDVLAQKGPISLKVYREDGTIKVIENFKVSDLHLAEWREVV